MTNAVRVAADLIGRLPRDRLSPETTDGRDGFLHPYELSAGVAQATLRILLRDFQTEELARQRELLEEAVAQTKAAFPKAQIEMSVTTQYRNLREGLAKEPRAVAYAARALEKLGRTAELTRVRGGTDGARLSYMGLLTPNVWAGGQNFHSVREWVSLEWMASAVEATLEILTVWVEKSE